MGAVSAMCFSGAVRTHRAVDRSACNPSRPLLLRARASAFARSSPLTRPNAANPRLPVRWQRRLAPVQAARQEDRRERRRQQQDMVGEGQVRIQDQVAEKLGVSVGLVEAGFMFAGVLLGLSVVGALAIPALITGTMLLPVIIVPVIMLLVTGAIVSSVLPVVLVGAGFATAGLFTGLVVPAAVVTALGFGVVYVLGGGNSKQTEDNVVDVESTVVQPTEDEMELERLQNELAEFDRRLLGDAVKWSVAEVGLWLGKAGYANLVPKFETNAIDGKTLLTLDSSDLRDELGVEALTTRKALLAEIEKLR